MLLSIFTKLGDKSNDPSPLTGVAFSDCSLLASFLRLLSAQQSLQMLEIHGCNVKGMCMPELLKLIVIGGESCTSLRSLMISGSQFDHVAVDQLTRLPQLKDFVLQGSCTGIDVLLRQIRLCHLTAHDTIGERMQLLWSSKTLQTLWLDTVSPIHRENLLSFDLPACKLFIFWLGIQWCQQKCSCYAHCDPPPHKTCCSPAACN